LRSQFRKKPRKPSVWGGHSCPPPLKLICIPESATMSGLYRLKIKIKINVKGGGQECPPHTRLGHASLSNLLFPEKRFSKPLVSSYYCSARFLTLNFSAIVPILP
jgi:hypothetical protein